MSATNVKQAWTEVADELSALALKLKYHVQEEFTDDDHESEVKASLKRLADALDGAVEVVEHVAEDPAVRDDLKETGRLLIDALTTTVDEAVSGVRSAVKK